MPRLAGEGLLQARRASKAELAAASAQAQSSTSRAMQLSALCLAPEEVWQARSAPGATCSHHHRPQPRGGLPARHRQCGLQPAARQLRQAPPGQAILTLQPALTQHRLEGQAAAGRLGAAQHKLQMHTPGLSCCVARRSPRHGRPRGLTFEEGELAPDIDAGTRVRVTAELTVFHVPKHPQLQLQGLEGEVVENVVNYKGAKISANLPYRVQFIRPQEGKKDLKFFSHLVRACTGGTAAPGVPARPETARVPQRADELEKL